MVNASHIKFDDQGFVLIQPVEPDFIKFLVVMDAYLMASARAEHKDLASLCDIRLELIVKGGEWPTC